MGNKSKRAYFPQFRRFQFIDRKIRSGAYPNQNTLRRDYIEEFEEEISIRTLSRDIEKMIIEMEAPIQYDSSKKGYYYGRNDFQLPFLRMGEDEIFALFLAENTLQKYIHTPIYKKLSQAFNKLKNLLQEDQEIKISWIQPHYTFLERNPAFINEAIWETISLSLKQEKTLAIEYQKPNANPFKMLVEPYHIINDRGQFYLIAYVPTFKDLRVYNFSRILGAEIKEENYRIPKTFHVQEFIKDRFGFQPDSAIYQFKIEFVKEAAQLIREREWWPGQTITKKENGNILVEFMHNSPFEVRIWVSQWDHRAIVLEPDFFRQSVKNCLMAALENYK